jgi:hypothetical protein
MVCAPPSALTMTVDLIAALEGVKKLGLWRGSSEAVAKPDREDLALKSSFATWGPDGLDSPSAHVSVVFATVSSDSRVEGNRKFVR